MLLLVKVFLLIKLLKKMKYKLIENILEQGVFENLSNTFNGTFVPWFYNDSSNWGEDNNFIFTHYIYREDGEGIASKLFNDISPIVLKAKILSNKFDLLRIKANLYTKQGKNIYHSTHTDFPELDKYTTVVYNFTTCNGGTVLFIDDKEIVIPSIENSLLIFDGNTPHQGFTQTDTNNRVLLNMDFV